MPYQRPDLPAIRDRLANDIDRFSGVNARQRGSVENAFANAFSGAIHGLYGLLNYYAKQLFDDTADDEFLIRRAAPFGVVPIAAKPATGIIVLTGSSGAAVPAGSLLQSIAGDTYRTVASVTVSSGSASVTVESVGGGASANKNSGETLTFISPVASVDTTATVDNSGLVGGADAETMSRFRARFAERKKQPPRGGTSDDYVAWAKQASVDVTRVWVSRHKNPANATEWGSVRLYFVTDDLPSIIPSSVVRDAVYNYIHLPKIRPVGAKNVYVETLTAVPLNLVFSSLSPDDDSTKQSITAEIQDLVKREAVPGGTLPLSHIREAISIAAGEYDYTLTSPPGDVTVAYNEILIPGVITWP